MIDGQTTCAHSITNKGFSDLMQPRTPKNVRDFNWARPHKSGQLSPMQCGMLLEAPGYPKVKALVEGQKKG